MVGKVAVSPSNALEVPPGLLFGGDLAVLESQLLLPGALGLLREEKVLG